MGTTTLSVTYTRLPRYAHILEGLDERALGKVWDENIVRCDAGLTRIHALTPHDTACSNLEVTFGVDNDGRLPSELQKCLHQYFILKAWIYLKTDG